MRAALAAAQLADLRSLVAELIPANRFYACKLAAAGVTFDLASLEDFSARFPFTTKPELVADQQAHPPFGTNRTYPLERYTRFHQTSGTTGTPLRWLDTPESWEVMVADWVEVFRAAGVGAGERVYFAFSYGPFIGFWLAFEAAARLGCLCLPGGGLSSVARLRAMLDNAATVLCCTPTYAMRLAEVAAQAGLSLRESAVRRLMVAGEPGGSIPSVRARLQELWPAAQVFDHHGMTEVGPVTYQCPARPGMLHVMESSFYAEILDPASGRPVPAGDPGELVLTTLGRVAAPMLRYRTGDLVRAEVRMPSDSVEPPCVCGRHELTLAGGILGRVDDMVIIRGVNVYPSAVEEIVRSCGGIAEYRVQLSTRHHLPELSLEIEPLPECADPAALAEKVTRGFETALALRVPVAVVSAGTLPRFEMKAKRWR
jgi:phenylacetate-CoA ligase